MHITSASQRRVQTRRASIRVALAAALCLPALTLAPTAAQARPSAATVASYETRVVAAVNVERVRHARRAVSSWSCLDRYAEPWSAYLARTDQMVHRSMMVVLRGCSATRVAENLARANVGPERVVALWMASPGHRANLLDGRLTNVAVAATYARGQWTVVLNMGRP